MITILAEKPDVGNKIAAALDCITLSSGKKISFKDLKANEKAVKAQQHKDGYLKINFSGEECYITWGYGHLVELKQAKDYNSIYRNWKNISLPFIPDKYEIQLKQTDGAKKQFNVIKKLFDKSRYIINATDDDREGEVIFAYIYELAECHKPVKRACFSSQTQKGICAAFDLLIDGNKRTDIRNAGYMRNIADWVIGSNLTVAMTLKSTGSEILSIGRVQTPTLAMVVNRELSIRDFKSAKYWTIQAAFSDCLTHTKSYKAEHCIKRFDKRSDAQSVLDKITGKPGTITKVEKKLIEKEPPNLYSLSSLQMEANSIFGYTLKQTLDIAQSLYDNGYITYPRTNSQYLTDDMEPTVCKVLDVLEEISEYKPLIHGKTRIFDRKRYFDSKKVESHYAIIPTENTPSSLTKEQSNIYNLVARSVIKMLYKAAIIEKVNVITTVESEDFLSSGTHIVDLGWMVCGGGTEEHPLPELFEGENYDGDYTSKEKETEPPKRYTEKTLLSAMLSAGKMLEDAELRKIMSDLSVKGIGTEATRAAIIETLVNRGYIERKGKSIFATDKGISLIQCLPLDEIKSAELTAQWESRLDDIAKGKENPNVFQKDIEELTRKWCKELSAAATHISSEASSESEYVCPICKTPMKNARYSWMCTNTSCGFSLGHEICGKKLTDAQTKKILTSGQSNVISGFKSKTGKTFKAALAIDKEKKRTVFVF